jgi:hypothetical protein
MDSMIRTPAREVALKIRLVDRNVLESDRLLVKRQFHDPVHHEKREAVRDQLHDPHDVDGNRARSGDRSFRHG